MQVISCSAQSQLLPPEEAIPLTKQVNDSMAEAAAKYPSRLAAFAALPWSDPDTAAAELKRAVGSLGLKGVLLAGRASSGPVFLDNPAFTPILEAAATLSVPIYIHPGCSLPAVQVPYYGGLGDELSARLSLFGWGWHNEAGIQVLRMILAGVFERFPGLQVISGHWGEMVPFYLSRLDQALPKTVTKLSRTITETFAQNIYVTPSGIFTYPQLQFMIQVLGAERIIHSVDFPLVSNEGAREFIENAPIAYSDKEKISHENVEKLLMM
jgi:predicted TIM-barrel fold metal-dependent hydrolase